MTYIFTDAPLTFILSIESSKIGATYPRIFFKFPDNSYVNFDVFLNHFFGMSENDWNSWIDDELITGAGLEEVCRDCGINYEGLNNILDALKEHCK